MSWTDRTIGLGRSLAIYYLIPFRQRRLRALYRQFVGPGDLVFDVGAHLGNRTRAFAALGCRVVAIEPQPHIAAALRRFVGSDPKITVVERAVAGLPGRAALAISERTPTVSTLATDWRHARSQDPDFGDVSWNDSVDVVVTTLDALIEEFGRPAFVKVDVEGGELGVLQGLSAAVPALSFEFLPRALEAAEACVACVQALGPYQFNWSLAESSALSLPSWVRGPALLAALRAEPPSRHGDIYARLDPQT